MQTDIQNMCGLHSVSKIFLVTLPETNIALENQRIGRLLSFWECLFSGATLASTLPALRSYVLALWIFVFAGILNLRKYLLPKGCLDI